MMNLFIGTTHFCVKCTRPFWQILPTNSIAFKQAESIAIHICARWTNLLAASRKNMEKDA